MGQHFNALQKDTDREIVEQFAEFYITAERLKAQTNTRAEMPKVVDWDVVRSNLQESLAYALGVLPEANRMISPLAEHFKKHPYKEQGSSPEIIAEHEKAWLESNLAPIQQMSEVLEELQRKIENLRGGLVQYLRDQARREIPNADQDGLEEDNLGTAAQNEIERRSQTSGVKPGISL